MKKHIAIIFLLTFASNIAQEQPMDTVLQKERKMQWFKDAKLGIFIHWGLYSVNGIDESWSFYNGYISHENYIKQTKGFTAKKYDPQAWADLPYGIPSLGILMRLKVLRQSAMC